MSDEQSPVVAPTAPGARPNAVREVISVFALAFVGTALLDRMRLVGGGDLGTALTAFMFLGLPLRLARREPNGAARFGIDLGGVLEPPEDKPEESGLGGIFQSLRRSLPQGLEEIGFAMLVMGLVFPPFIAGFYGWFRPSAGFMLSWPVDFGTFAASQVFLAALPEEAFFRGFVQTRLHDRYPPTHTFLGAHFHPGVLVAQAALFALVHLAVDPSVERLAVFFPGLLFGWARARRGGIGAAIVLHAASNVLSETLMRSWGILG